jgi:hypothetical protein
MPGLFREEPVELPPNVFHPDPVVGLFPEDLSLRRTNHEAVALETERVDELPVFFRRGIEVLAPDSALVILLQPAHGGPDFRADRSAGQKVVGHLQRPRLRREYGGKRSRKGDQCGEQQLPSSRHIPSKSGRKLTTAPSRDKILPSPFVVAGDEVDFWISDPGSKRIGRC